MKSNTFYFTHDFNAQNDPKIESMLFKHGWKGYGIFWALIEKLAQEPAHKLEKLYDRISFVLRETYETVKSVIEEFELFQFDDKFFWSERLIKHFEHREIISQKAKDSIKRRWDSKRESNKKDTNVLPTNYEGNTIKEIKVNKRKEKEKKENIGRVTKFIPPTISQVVEYFSINNFQKDPERFWNYYESNGWKIGKNPMKRWDLTANNWEKSEYGDNKNSKGAPKETTTQKLDRDIDNAKFG